jgi:hypothetical protein
VISPTADETDAVKRMASRPEGVMFKDYLQKCSADLHKRLVLADNPVTLRQLQGEARAIDMLLMAWKP